MDIRTKYFVFLQTLFLCIAVALAAATDDDYIKCVPGELNLILSAPHGGKLKPDSIPDRDAGCVNATAPGQCVWRHGCGVKDNATCKATVEGDYNTYLLTNLIREHIYTLTGKYPCTVYNNLHRLKYDANRDEAQGTFYVPAVQEAFRQYHACADDCRAKFSGRGLFLDIHGQSHKHGWLELGYMLTSAQLNSGNYKASDATVGGLSTASGLTIEDVVYGDHSLGRYMEDLGVGTLVSPKRSSPGTKDYFIGDYNIIRHGSMKGGDMDAILAESPWSRRKDDVIEDYSRIFATAVARFMEEHYGVKIVGQVWPKNGAGVAHASYALLALLVALVSYL